MSRDELLTLDQALEEIGVARATFYRWRKARKGPRCVKLPNGAIRVRRSEIERFLTACIE